ncbi:heavy metal-associated domain-containing protein [Mesorhizobium sp. CAU 1741]|uniref:heavy-metal-associated domain-containing protein n=1 Tax=Mesorhizobium sp. CAU 1741 TaxID=3140366 RepID=UPI00325ACD5E
MDISLKVEGMTCGGCKAAVERVLRAQPGVSAVTVDLEAGSAKVSSEGSADPAGLVAAVENAGYDARIDG